MTGQHEHRPGTAHQVPDWARAIGVAALLTVALGVIFIAFAWPSAHSAPRDVPIGITGPAAQVAVVTERLDRASPGAFALTHYPSQAKLEEAAKGRVIYGGFVLSPPAPSVVIATGGSPAVAQTLSGIGQQLGKQTGLNVSVKDLAPLPSTDPRGVGLAAAALPMTLGGLLPAAALTLLFPGRTWLKALTATGFSFLGALTITAILDWLGATTENFWGVTAGLTLGMMAISFSITGLGAMLGFPGIGLGAAVAILVGNPLSGLTSAPEFLPKGLGLLGQFLPPGANGTLLRSMAYFDGAGSAGVILILCCWVGFGAAMLALDGVRQRAALRSGAAERDPVGANA
ncbi:MULTISPECIES: ABC transporter permease [unclassified Mycobacteroides]|uniref:ABC transporter permease n=1 Tax=unclassified Mycobacteroides TaxID=2618759 RepID=UPI001EEFFBCE|nr:MULTISPECIES: ABC transporter permease [unclassified Mycobacteroides]